MGFWKSVVKSAGGAIVTPVRTTRGLLSAGKDALKVGAAGYVGWEMIGNDKSVGRIVGETLVGKDMVDAVGNVGETLSGITEGTSGALSDVKETMNGVNENMNGVKKFLGGLFSGNGVGMFGDFFSNLGKGNVSGMGIAGLIGAALLTFGRFGWMGKIAGLLLGMFIIGNNIGKDKSMTQSNGAEAKGKSLSYSRATVYSPEGDPSKVFVKAWDLEGKSCPAIEITREQYDELKNAGYSPVQIYHGLKSMQQQPEGRGASVGR